MKTKIISIVVMLMVVCNVMAQDYMRVYFKDGSERKFYLKDITSITTKKLDADGIQHSDYEYQHITTHHNKYVYNLNEVDSITFTNINEELEEQHFVDGMSTVMSAITENSLIYDVDFLIYLITQSEAVEDAWSDGNTLNVKIKDNETFSFIINHYHNFVGEYERSSAKIRTMLPEIASASNQTETQLRAVIANQRHKDESSRWEQSAIFDPLIELLESNSIQVDYVEEPTVDFFRSNLVSRISDEGHMNLYDYDLIFLNTPGSYNSVSYLRNEQDANAPYGLKGHSFLTSEDILQFDETEFPKTEEDWGAFYLKIKEWRYQLDYDDATDQHISIGFTNERRDGKPCYVGHPMLTEYFFRDIVTDKTKFLNPNSILFDGASQSLMGDDTSTPSYSLAEQFVQRGLGAFIGYDNISDMGLYAGSSFYNNMLSGKSVQKSYEDISEYERNPTGNYNNERIVAHLLMYPQNNPSLQQLFLHPTHTIQVNQSEIRGFFEPENTVRVEGIAASTDSRSISYGFIYGKNENLSDAAIVEASEVDTLTDSMTDWKGNVKFNTLLTNLKADNTYYYCAFTYDGLFYNYGDTLSFYFDCPVAEAIDLGLPSGTLWASWNIGASKPEEYGSYFAWGETEEKDYYSWETYSYGNDWDDCVFIGDDIAGTVYDVAHVKWGGSWRMPSVDQIKELYENCSLKWTSQNGVLGLLVTGPNGMTIFLPPASLRYNDRISDVDGLYGYYWSSTCYWDGGNAIDFQFYAGYSYTWSSSSRHLGLPVRAVCFNESLPGISISKNSVELFVGNSTSIEITSGSDSYELTNSNTNAVDAKIVGTTITLKALSMGCAVITVKTASSERKASINVTVSSPSGDCPDVHHPHLVDLGLPSGTKWACCNVGANNPEEYGGYYAWGETEEKESYNWKTYIHCDGSEETCHDIGEDIAGTEYDVAHAKWGGTWRMPTNDQIKELMNKCKTVRSVLNGVYGLLVIGPNGASIFMPIPGNLWYGNLRDENIQGYYWSSTIHPDHMEWAWCLQPYYDWGQFLWGGYYRANGLSVRPVSNTISIPDITLSKYTISLTKGSGAAIDITSGSGNYEVSNSNTSVVEATLDGTTITLKGLSGGSAVVTVKDISSGQTATINVNVTSYNYPEPEAIDLGLPSGTKWASWNVGADEPGEYGRYFRWGEIEPFNWGVDYKYYDIETKEYIYIGDDISGTDYDVAHVQWGGGWRMPTDDQIQELLDYCSSKYDVVFTTQQTGLGMKTIVVSGLRFVGMNGNSIFLPFAGEYDSTRGIVYEDSLGEYWSSTLSDLPNSAFFLRIHWQYRDYPPRFYFASRSDPCSIRAVYCNGLTLSQKNVRLETGETTAVKIYLGSGNYELSCSDMSIVEYALHGTTITLTAKAIGDAEVLVMDKSSGSSETINVSVYSRGCPIAEAIDLGLPSGTKWASWNVGATKPEECGGYYAWGETGTKEYYVWSTYTHCDGAFSNCFYIGDDIAGTEYDVAHVKWGGTWRMPSVDQIQELINNCTRKGKQQNGVNGILITGPNGNSIFMPTAGSRWKDDLSEEDSSGYYWSSSLRPHSDYENYACHLYLHYSSSNMNSNYSFRAKGLSVRPVCP